MASQWHNMELILEPTLTGFGHCNTIPTVEIFEVVATASWSSGYDTGSIL